MDINLLTQFLAPMLPYLLKGAIEAAKSAAGELGKRLSADGWEGMKKLAEKIQQKAEAKPALQEALADAQNDPKDADNIASLRKELKKLLQEDPDLLAEATRLLTPIQATSTTVIASGNRSVAIGGNVSGSTIITGDNNKA